MNGWWGDKILALSHLSFMRTFSTTFMLAGSLIFVGWMSTDKFVDIYNSQSSVQTIMDLEREISRLRVQYRDAHPEALQAAGTVHRAGWSQCTRSI